MTIFDAFKYNDVITIDYYKRAFNCCSCSNYYREFDEEFSFSGNLEDFNEKYTNGNYHDILNLNTEIFPADCGIEELTNEFEFYEVTDEVDICPICWRAKGLKESVKIDKGLLAELFVYFGLHDVFGRDEYLENWILNGLKKLYDCNFNNFDKEFSDIHQSLASIYNSSSVRMEQEELESLYHIKELD